MILSLVNISEGGLPQLVVNATPDSDSSCRASDCIDLDDWTGNWEERKSRRPSAGFEPWLPPLRTLASVQVLQDLSTEPNWLPVQMYSVAVMGELSSNTVYSWSTRILIEY